MGTSSAICLVQFRALFGPVCGVGPWATSLPLFPSPKGAFPMFLGVSPELGGSPDVFVVVFVDDAVSFRYDAVILVMTQLVSC